MKYINITYSVNGLEKQNQEEIDKELSIHEEKYFNHLTQFFPNYTLPEISAVLTEDILYDIQKFYESEKSENVKLDSKGINFTVKIIVINQKTRIFWNYNVYSEYGIKAYFAVLLEHLIGNIYKDKLKISDTIDVSAKLYNVSKQLCQIWYLHTKCSNIRKEIVDNIDEGFDSMDKFTFAFKRNIKKLHYNYQENINHGLFFEQAIVELEIYIRRIITDSKSQSIQGLDEFKEPIEIIVRAINILLKEPVETLDFNKCEIADQIKLILEKCDIHLPNIEKDFTIAFEIKEGPKSLFPDLIDTHPRILCFMDILGFKDIINEYETVNSSMALLKLKKCFDAARKASLETLVTLLSPDTKKHIDFKMFSDCIIISFPYVEFGIDIKKGLFEMVLILNVFQQTFMKEGFYLRGHVTMGSHYSDDNMIFSGALVEAYQNEGKSIYPIITVNDKLIKKIEKKHEFDNTLLSFDKLLIRHHYPSSLNIFINPYYSVESIGNMEDQFSNVFGSLLGADFGQKLANTMNKAIDGALKSQGMSSLEEELKKDKETILSVLAQKYASKRMVYDNLNYPHTERMIASKVMDKYLFLFNLISWLNDKEGDLFEYLNLLDYDA